MYKDLLAVTSTSEFVFIKLIFNETVVKGCFYDFLLNHLEFVKISDSTDGGAQNDDDDVEMDVKCVLFYERNVEND